MPLTTHTEGQPADGTAARPPDEVARCEPLPSGPVVVEGVGPELATNGPSVLRARPPSRLCASNRVTVAPASAHSMAATSPASPPPTTVTPWFTGLPAVEPGTVEHAFATIRAKLGGKWSHVKDQ